MTVVTCSVHKEPVAGAAIFHRMIQEVPDTVVIAYIGRSNGAGPVLSAMSTIPVITVPASVKEFPDDVWSSLRAPSAVPVMTVLEPSNAVLAALQILSGAQSAALCACARRDRKPDGQYHPALTGHGAGERPSRRSESELRMTAALDPDAPLIAEIERLQGRDRGCAERKIRELEARADIDPLLDILNRRGFMRELKRSLAYLQALRKAKRRCCSSISTASRRSTTRTATPPATPCSRRWRRSSPDHVRASDVVARLGGDEFCVLLWNLGAGAGGDQGA